MIKTLLTASHKEPSRDSRETESYGPESERSTSTDAGELNSRTYTKDRMQIEAKPLTHARHLKRHN